MDSLAVLVVDLNDPDQHRALATLGAFENLGIPRRRDLIDGTALALAPPGWSYFLWPWQVAILAGKHPRTHAARKLLFTELLCPALV